MRIRHGHETHLVLWAIFQGRAPMFPLRGGGSNSFLQIPTPLVILFQNDNKIRSWYFLAKKFMHSVFQNSGHITWLARVCRNSRIIHTQNTEENLCCQVRYCQHQVLDGNTQHHENFSYYYCSLSWAVDSILDLFHCNLELQLLIEN